jgi:predicted nucleic acid-binding protein
MSATPVIDVVSDANVALKWFHEHGEEDVEPARELLARHRAREVMVHVLDLTFYEVGNALLRGRAQATAAQTATVLAALREICPVLAPDDEDLGLAAELAAGHDLTLCDATYAAVARRRAAPLVTLDRDLLAAGLGTRPTDLVARLQCHRPSAS